MYNFLVTSLDNAWYEAGYSFAFGRFLQQSWTSESLIDRYRSLSPTVRADLMGLPTLFTYEGRESEVRIGHLKVVEERGSSIYVEPDLDNSIPAFSFAKLWPIRERLDIQGSELNTTHWSIKNQDLIAILADAGLIPDRTRGLGAPPVPIEDMRFKVALSFAGENRETIAEIAAHLKRQLGRNAVFYDNDYKAQLARPNLGILLQDIYLKQSDLVVSFLCENYARKRWPGLEMRSVQELLSERKADAIMYVRFDDAEVKGVSKLDGFVDARQHSAEEIARMIIERVRLNEARMAVPKKRRSVSRTTPRKA
jgi:hypothetical protein